uniref:dolichol kinase n=1 Tax=Leersia perrieri TaxID=77586 RepID=A0A0D9VCH8_9ORYZ
MDAIDAELARAQEERKKMEEALAAGAPMAVSSVPKKSQRIIDREREDDYPSSRRSDMTRSPPGRPPRRDPSMLSSCDLELLSSRPFPSSKESTKYWNWHGYSLMCLLPWIFLPVWDGNGNAHPIFPSNGPTPTNALQSMTSTPTGKRKKKRAVTTGRHATQFAKTRARECTTATTTTHSHRQHTYLGVVSDTTTPAASSGILFGATTLPSVMLSRLIQLSRVLKVDPNGHEVYAYLDMQYWASPNNGISNASKYGWLLIILYPLAYLFNFLLKADGGEAILVSSGLVLYCGDMLSHTLSKGVLLGLFLLPLLYKNSLQVLTYGRKLERQSTQTVGECTQKRIYCVPSWTHLVQGFEVHPFVWVFNYIFTDSRERISKQSKTERILLRKYYHLAAVLIFSPAVVFQVWEIYPLGHIVHQFMNAFTDHRDSEILVVSHFSLFLGCTLPKWMSSGFNDRPLIPFAGILSLGIGDTMVVIPVSPDEQLGKNWKCKRPRVNHAVV